MAPAVMRSGGAREVLPEIAIWLVHKAIGHPVADLVAHTTIAGKPSPFRFYCRGCGADNLLNPNPKGEA